MKSKTEQIDELAFKAMECILTGVYSNPAMIVQISLVAEENKQSPAMEIAERAYQMADCMLKKKAKMNADIKK